MRSLTGTLILLAFFIATTSTSAQKVLLVEKPGKFKNYKYFIGDNIVLKVAPYGNKHEGTIHVISDTSLIMNFDDEIMIDDIEMILRPRWGLKLLSRLTRIAGAGYLLLDVVNNTITGNSTIVDKNTLIISAGMVAFSYALVPFHNKRMKAGDSWRISVLDFSLDEDAPNPFR